MPNNTASKPLHTQNIDGEGSSIPKHYFSVYKAMERSVSSRQAVSFSLHDIAPIETWTAHLRGETSHFLVGGALSGALAALRAVAALPLDVACCPDAPPGGAVNASDMQLARSWLSDGLRREANLPAEQTTVTDVLAARGWLNHSIRLTSLILAVYSVASFAVRVARRQEAGAQ
jgi:hypothetical protein